MNPQLAALFAQHRTAALAAGAAGVAGLALLQRKRKAAGTPAGATAGATVPTTIAGTLPAAAVIPQQTGSTGAGGYDSSSYDTYNALQPELAAILQAQQALATSVSSGITAAPAPTSSPILAPPAPAPAPAAPKRSIAQTLFAPTGTGNYVKYGDGTLGEVESDGSIYGIAFGEPINSSGDLYVPGKNPAPTALPWQHWNDNPAAEPTYGDKVHNLAAAKAS